MPNNQGQNLTLIDEIRSNNHNVNELSNWLINKFENTDPSVKFYKNYKWIVWACILLYFILATLLLVFNKCIHNWNIFCQFLLWIACIAISILPALIYAFQQTKVPSIKQSDLTNFNKIIGQPNGNEIMLISLVFKHLKSIYKNKTNSNERQLTTLSTIFVWLGNTFITIYFAFFDNTNNDMLYWIFVLGLIFSLTGIVINLKFP